MELKWFSNLNPTLEKCSKNMLEIELKLKTFLQHRKKVGIMRTGIFVCTYIHTYSARVQPPKNGMNKQCCRRIPYTSQLLIRFFAGHKLRIHKRACTLYIHMYLGKHVCNFSLNLNTCIVSFGLNVLFLNRDIFKW